MTRYRITIESEADTPRDALLGAQYSRPFEDWIVEIVEPEGKAQLATEPVADDLQVGKYSYQFVGDFHASIDLCADNDDSAHDKAGGAGNEHYDFSNDIDDLRLVWSDDPDAEVED